ncbi:hypothetical protein LSAT2_029814 [Lamellibrachia satsuma]|nr:hypothetical protein LSAT2_029814 [Lamellibrachia satsuma]
MTVARRMWTNVNRTGIRADCYDKLRHLGDMRNETRQSWTTYLRPEPRPDWVEARQHWGWTWQLHTYGFALLFTLLGVYVLVVSWHIRKRLRVQQHVVALVTILLVLCSSRSLYLLLDPYESKRSVPVALERAMYGVVFPCLTSSFSLIQVVFMRITRSSLGHRKLRRYRLLGAVMTSHFSIVVVVDVTVAYRPNLKLLILLCQSLFVVANIVLCFSFVYNGLRVAQFTNEANRALKQLIAYGRLRRSVMQQGNRREMALHRINKPRIRSVSEMHIPGSDDASHNDSTSSSGDEAYFNDARLVFDDEQLAHAYQNNCVDGCTPGTNAVFERGNHVTSPSALRTALRTGVAAESFDDVSNSVSDSDQTSREDTQMTEATVDGQRNSCSSMSRLVVNQTGQLLPSGDVYATSDNSYVNGALQLREHTRDHLYSTCYVLASDLTPLPESGYVADTEYSSPKLRAKTSATARKSKVKETVSVRDESANTDSPAHQPFTLPTSDGSFGLHRIRQGCVLRTALRVSYVTTIFSCVCAVLQTYAMFGVYGVLSNEHVAQAWPWYIYQTCMR